MNAITGRNPFLTSVFGIVSLSRALLLSVNGLDSGIDVDVNGFKQKVLYLFLCLAADRQGLSFYGDQRIQSYFQLNAIDLDTAKQELIHKDLIAYDGHLYQVLSLPRPMTDATIRQQRTGKPESFKDILARLAATGR